MSNNEATFVKFLRFFTSRLVQTLVQARLGIKIEQECCGSAGQSNWFSLKIDELGEIAAYLRSAIDEYPPKCEAITIEFLLYTSDGLHLPLESWVISIDDEDKDEDININTDFYHRLGTALRSVAAAARVTPMYRYFVKRQSQDTFIYKGTMDADLGKDAKHLSIAVLPSPFGAMNLDLSYRTNMTLPSNEDSRITPETDAAKLKESEHLPCRPSFSDCVPVVGGDLEDAPTITTLNFQTSPAQPPGTPQPRFRIGRSTSSEESTQSQQLLSSSLDARDCGYIPAKPVYRRTESFPFEQLLASSLSPRKRQSTCSEACSEPIIENPLPEIDEALPQTSETASQNKSPEKERVEEESDEDDASYVKVFEPINDNTANLSQFIKECRTAPMNIAGFSEDNPHSLMEQLQRFSAQEKEFEKFMNGINSNPFND